MKKKTGYLLAAAGLCMGLLSGCGDMGYGGDNYVAPSVTPGFVSPNTFLPEMEELIPEIPVPDIEDGIVEDRDGIITESDNRNRENNAEARNDETTAGTAGRTNNSKNNGNNGNGTVPGTGNNGNGTTASGAGSTSVPRR